MSRVSLVIPVYNRARLLREAVASAQATGFDALEIVVVDDGSTDGTLEVARALAHEDGRIRVLQHPDGRNHGPGPTLNLGMRAATAPYVGFLGSDDLLLPGRFDVAVATLDARADVDGVYETTVTEFMAGGESRRATVRPVVSFECDDPEAVLAKLLTHGKHWSADAILVRRDVLLRVGGFSADPLLRGVEDLVLWLKLAAAARLVGGHAQPVAVYRLHDSNLSSMDRRRQLALPLRAYVEVVRWSRGAGVPAPKRALLQRALADKLFYCCGELRALGAPRLALEQLAVALRALPRLARQRLFWANLLRAAAKAVRGGGSGRALRAVR